MPIVTAEYIAYHVSKRSAATAEWVQDFIDADDEEFVDEDYGYDPYGEFEPGPIVEDDPDAASPFWTL